MSVSKSSGALLDSAGDCGVLAACAAVGHTDHMSIRLRITKTPTAFRQRVPIVQRYDIENDGYTRSYSSLDPILC
jgi:hypothetical protein